MKVIIVSEDKFIVELNRHELISIVGKNLATPGNPLVPESRPDLTVLKEGMEFDISRIDTYNIMLARVDEVDKNMDDIIRKLINIHESIKKV